MKVLVSDNLSAVGVEILKKESGLEVDVKTGLSKEELIKIISDYDGLIVRSATKVVAEIIKAADNLKVIGRAGVGVDNIDLAAAGTKGIIVMNAPEGNMITTAEHTLALLLSMSRNIPQASYALKNRKWAPKEFMGVELFEKTLGIVGLGRIGSRVARRLQGWECEVVYSDIIDISEELEQELNVTRLPLDEVLQTADVITLHVPLGTQTRHMISDREFDMMKPTVIFINACRGPVVDEAALIRALNDGKVAAAGLDVLEQEPTPVDNPLLKMDNVLVTPHLAAFSQEAGEKSRMFAITNSARVAGGDEPDSVVPSTDF